MGLKSFAHILRCSHCWVVLCVYFGRRSIVPKECPLSDDVSIVPSMWETVLIIISMFYTFVFCVVVRKALIQVEAELLRRGAGTLLASRITYTTRGYDQGTRTMYSSFSPSLWTLIVQRFAFLSSVCVCVCEYVSLSLSLSPPRPSIIVVLASI